MKINEITNAEDILALWKLISDNTWSAIQQQAEQQAREEAEQAAKTKSTKGTKRGGLPSSLYGSLLKMVVCACKCVMELVCWILPNARTT